MYKSLIIFLPFLLAACGSFPLAKNISAPPGKTADQQQNDILFCKDQAHTKAGSDSQQVKAFLLGLTIVGTPVAIENDKALQREEFAKCMVAKGYTVSPVQSSQ